MIAPGRRGAARRRHRRDGSVPARHDVPRSRAAALRRGAVHVPRPGADPAQDHRFRRRRQRHAGPALRAHLARSRHRLRHRRTRHRQSREPDRRARACRRGWPRAAPRSPAPPEPPVPAPAPDLPPLRDVIRRHGLAARKSLGQNFLLDLNLTRRIARAAGPLDADRRDRDRRPVRAGSPARCSPKGARRVVAIERDARCIAALEELGAAFPGRLDDRSQATRSRSTRRR